MRGGLSRPAGYALAVLLLLAGWEALALLLDSPALPGPAEALPLFVTLVPELVPHALLSLWRVVASMVIGTALGQLVLGMSVGMCLGIVVAALSNMRKDR